MSGPLEAAQAAWGADLPDWIEALANECAATSQNKVAKRLGKSAGLVNQLIHNKYNAGTTQIEQTVRGVLMAATVQCPMLNQVPAHECQKWQAKARETVLSNGFRNRMRRACLHCPQNARNAE